MVTSVLLVADSTFPALSPGDHTTLDQIEEQSSGAGAVGNIVFYGEGLQLWTPCMEP